MARSKLVPLALRCGVVVAALGLGGYALNPSPALAMQEKAAGQVFQDEGKHFTCTVPAGWTVGETTSPQMVAMFNSEPENAEDAFNENVNVIIVDLGADAAGQVTLEETVTEALEGFKAMEGATVGEVKKTKLGGDEAMHVVNTLNMQGMTLRSEQTYAMRGNLFYVITYTTKPEANAKIDGAAQALLDSWKYLD